jgi:hypothetical protein
MTDLESETGLDIELLPGFAVMLITLDKPASDFERLSEAI